MPRAKIKLPKAAIADFCRRHRIRKLALFGSVLRSDFEDESDIDVLVEFQPGFVPGLEFFAMESELAAILRRKVDLNTPAFLSKYFRERTVAEAEVEYVAP
ncbi:MAG: nucleotidyltransferase family protein [Candidatus Binataceae bacterium]